MASIKKRPNGQWRARYRDEAGKEHARHFKYKDNPRDPGNSAQHWLNEETASLTRDEWVTPSKRNTTMNEWCDTWMAGYERHRASTGRQGRTHVKRIKEHFGTKLVRSIRPSDVNSWIVSLQAEELAESTIYPLHSRLAQILTEAVHEGILTKTPTSRRTSPPSGTQRPYVATTEQVWALYDAMPTYAQRYPSRRVLRAAGR